jgi:hypothetical protein
LKNTFETFEKALIVDEVQGARNARSGMYTQYLSILSTAQRSNSPQEVLFQRFH